MGSYSEIKKMLCRELDYIVSKGELTPRDLDFVDKITHSIASVDKIMRMEGNGMPEYSGGGLYNSYDRSYDGSYDGSYDRSYDYNMSGRRDSMGRFAPSRGYSRDESKSQMVDRLEKMMNESSNKEERETIQRIMNELKTM